MLIIEITEERILNAIIYHLKAGSSEKVKISFISVPKKSQKVSFTPKKWKFSSLRGYSKLKSTLLRVLKVNQKSHSIKAPRDGLKEVNGQ